MDQLGRTDAAREMWLHAMAHYPILIQRPIITADDGKARVVRDNDALVGVLPRSVRWSVGALDS
ncbi:hypothetical protein [Nocardioides sp.]|uniref:hypothetical protein n=1 Tax=Nocardioides sp. TaxID=35761 RepID=UPI0034DF643A